MEIILYIAAIIVMIWSIAVQGRLKRLVTKFSKEQAASGKTANDCVREMLAMNDVYGVTMDHVGGELTDNFNPKENKIYLSDSVDGGTSITAIAIAAHECGHACQASDAWLPFKIRQLIAPFAGIASKISVWIAGSARRSPLSSLRKLIFRRTLTSFSTRSSRNKAPRTPRCEVLTITIWRRDSSRLQI